MARIKGSVGTTRGFLQSVNKSIRNFEDKSEIALQNTMLEMYDQLRAATPIDTGNLRDSLVVHINGQGDVTTVTGPNRSGGEQSISNIMNMKLGDRASFVYHATYARRLNYGFVGADSLGRVYNQAGRFWIEAVGSRYRSIARRVATALKLQMK